MIGLLEVQSVEVELSNPIGSKFAATTKHKVRLVTQILCKLAYKKEEGFVKTKGKRVLYQWVVQSVDLENISSMVH